MVLSLRSVGGFGAVIALLVCPHGDAESKPLTITIEQGRQLVYALLKQSGCTAGTCAVDRLSNNYFPQFIFYQAFWPNPSGSPLIGSWAIDPQTADIWDANLCAEYSSSAVVRLQQRLRKRIGVTQDTYKKLKQRPPMCDPDEKVEVRRGKY